MLHESLEPRLAHELRVGSNREIAPDVWALRFARAFDFLPGQIVAVTLGPGFPARYYSIASGSGEDEVELLYDLVPGGVLTPGLSRLEAGAHLFVSDPFGTFVDTEREAWWIATGTGIAPFASMVRSGRCAGRRLIHGARTLERFYYRAQLSEALGSSYLCCCSAESAQWAYPGRLTTWLAQQEALPRGIRYMLCGGAGMVVEVRDLLIARGVSYEDIIAEIYF